VPVATVHALGLGLAWLGVWVGGFSAAATKLPNYVLPAYPAAALLVAVVAVEAARRAAASGRWPHPRWAATGTLALAFGGVATIATVIIAARYGLPGAEPAAIVGVVPLVGAVGCWWLATRHRPEAALAWFTGTALAYTALAVGPAAGQIASANSIPSFVSGLRADGEAARVGTYMIASPNVVFYATGHVNQIVRDDTDAAARFLGSGPDAVLLVTADRLAAVEAVLPAGYGEVGRARPMFRDEDVVAIGRIAPADRTAGGGEVAR
jgi:4-amino-4-deoxy-L-arabinose transferase-like glycosyltransferase